MTGYPALVDDGDSVALTLLDTRAAADAATRRGVVRLIALELGDALLRYAEGRAPAWTTIGAAAARRRTDRPRCRTTCARPSPIARSSATIRCRATATAFAEQVKRARTRLPAVVDGALRAAGRDRRRATRR